MQDSRAQMEKLARCMNEHERYFAAAFNSEAFARQRFQVQPTVMDLEETQVSVQLVTELPEPLKVPEDTLVRLDP